MQEDTQPAYDFGVLQSSMSSRPSAHCESQTGIAEELRESARRVRDLERVRVQLARTLLDVQQACEVSRDPDHAQRLISAAVRDLEELDARLFEARTMHTATERCEGLLAG